MGTKPSETIWFAPKKQDIRRERDIVDFWSDHLKSRVLSGLPRHDLVPNVSMLVWLTLKSQATVKAQK